MYNNINTGNTQRIDQWGNSWVESSDEHRMFLSISRMSVQVLPHRVGIITLSSSPLRIVETGTFRSSV